MNVPVRAIIEGENMCSPVVVTSAPQADTMFQPGGKKTTKIPVIAKDNRSRNSRKTIEEGRFQPAPIKSWFFH